MLIDQEEKTLLRENPVSLRKERNPKLSSPLPEKKMRINQINQTFLKLKRAMETFLKSSHFRKWVQTPKLKTKRRALYKASFAKNPSKTQ